MPACNTLSLSPCAAARLDQLLWLAEPWYVDEDGELVQGEPFIDRAQLLELLDLLPTT